MARGILYVETRPISPETEAEYHTSYETHLADVVAVDGFVSARRFTPLGDDGPFVAIYEIDADDLQEARSRLLEASRSGKIASLASMQVDPPPVVRLLELRSACRPAPSEAST